MAGSEYNKKPGYTQKQGRKRSPIVSVLAALVIIVACAIYVLTGLSRDATPGPEAAGTPSEQTNLEPPSAPIADTRESPPPEPPEEPSVPKPPPVKVHGIYVDQWTIVRDGGVDRFIELCNRSVINAIVIDVKDDYGNITFNSSNEDFSKVSSGNIRNITQIVARLKENGIYTIARLVCFKDPLWSDMNPELAIHNNQGGVWEDDKGIKWLDPYNTDSWEYISTLAKEVARIGFDEVQLDYIRFPTEGKLDEINYGEAGSAMTKAEAIAGFLDYMRRALAGTTAWLSADAFGIIVVADGDFEGIGQDLDLMMQNSDYVCPMIYPSHFANKAQNKVGQMLNHVLYEIPDLEPYGVVYNVLQMVKSRLPEEGEHAVIRPYLQAFTASYLADGYYQVYTEKQVLEQIQAVYDAGFDEWILWSNSYDSSLFDKLGYEISSDISSENSDGSSSETPAANSA